jgi:hypothetical protein
MEKWLHINPGLVACKHVNQSESRTKTKYSEHFTPLTSSDRLRNSYEPRVPVDIYMKLNDITVMRAAYPACSNLHDLFSLTFDKYIMQQSAASCYSLPVSNKYSHEHPVLKHPNSVSFC